MAEVTLEIQQPNAPDVTFTGSAGAMRLQGRVVTSPIAASGLFFKWYSSLAGELIQHDGPSAAQYAPAQFAEPIKVGTHAITFTCKDQKPDTEAALQAVQHAGSAGGSPPDASNPRLVTVLIANLLAPANGASLSRNASHVLIAEAPSAWDDEAGYQAYNKVGYQWRFTRSSTTTVIEGDALTFAKAVGADDASDPLEEVNRVSYAGNLTQLAAGTYTLRLRVYNTDAPGTFHQSGAISVTLT